MDLASGVDCDLVARADGEAGVVVRPVVHDGLARRGVGLLIERARDGELARGASAEVVAQMGGLHVDRGGLRTGRDVRARRGRDAVLDVGTRERVRVERLDVEYDGDNVQIEP